MRTSLKALGAAFALGSTACGGGLSGSTERPSTIATIQGQIENPVDIPLDAGDFRVAIVWGIRDAEGKSLLRRAEDVAVIPVFPAQFRLDITQLPPTESFSPDAPIHLAGGSIVAYEDTNHNGKLDLVDPDAVGAVDRVLSVPTDTTLVYLEGDVSTLPGLEDDNGARPTPGFQFSQVEPLGQWACSGGPIVLGQTPPDCPGFRWQPITAPLTLSISSSPELSLYICQMWGGDSASITSSSMPGELGDFGGRLPAKSDPQLVCRADGRSFIYTVCTASGGMLCHVDRQCAEKIYTFDASVADAWPCPMN